MGNLKHSPRVSLIDIQFDSDIFHTLSVMARSATFGLNLVFKAVEFRNKATHLKSETGVG